MALFRRKRDVQVDAVRIGKVGKIGDDAISRGNWLITYKVGTQWVQEVMTHQDFIRDYEPMDAYGRQMIGG